MSESFIPASEFETASNAVNNILGQPVEEIGISPLKFHHLPRGVIGCY